MHILFIVPYTPNLIRTRPYNLIRHLGRRGHTITLLTLTTNAAETADAAALSRDITGVSQVYALPLPRWRSLLNCLAALPTRQPLQAAYCWQPALAHQLEQLLTSNNGRQPIDLIHVEHLRAARYALSANSAFSLHPSAFRKLPIVWDSVDCISHLFRQAAAHSHSFFGRWITRFELGRTERYEGWLPWQFDATLTTSPADCEVLTQLATRHSSLSTHHSPPIHVVPNGVDLDYFRPGSAVQRQPATLVFTGKMSYHANVTMARFLVRDVMPMVWTERSEVEVNIVGKDPGSDVLALGNHPRVTITANVPDMRPYLQKATLAVAPMTYGAGIQNKILEALACRTTVITTPQALVGLKARPDRDLLVAGDAPGLAQAILELLDDPQRRQALGAAGRAYVETHHSWDNAVARLEAIYQSLLVRQPTFQRQPAAAVSTI